MLDHVIRLWAEGCENCNFGSWRYMRNVGQNERNHKVLYIQSLFSSIKTMSAVLF